MNRMNRIQKFVLAGLIVFAGGSALQAQVKITQSDMPKSGTTVYFSTTADSIDVSTTGASQTWDFSKIRPTQNDTDQYAAPTGVYFLAFYGNIAEKTKVVGQTGFAFYKSSSSEWTQTGSGFKVPVVNTDAPLKFSKPDKIYALPMTYSDTWSDTFGISQQVSLGLFNVTIAIHGKRSTVVDGYGTISTPYVSNVKCIRLKSDIKETDSFYIGYQNDRTEYKWMAPGYKYPLMYAIETNGPLGKTLTVTYLDSARTLINPNAPKPDFTAVPDSNLFTGDTLTLQNNTKGFGINGWTISPGSEANGDFSFVNNTNAGSQSPQLIFAKAGKYTVSLTVNSFVNGSGTLTKTDYLNVSLAQSPVVDFMIDKSLHTPGQSVTLQDLSTNKPTRWSWTITPHNFSFVTGTDSTSQNPQMVFSKEGKYSVRLVASNNAGTGNSSKADYIVITTNGIEEASLNADILRIYPNPAHDAIQLSLSRPGISLSKVSWQILDISGRTILTGSATQPRISLESLSPGSYILKLTGPDLLVRKMLIKE